MGVTRLGHVGIYCDDLMKMRDFYSRVVGLTITDEDHDLGIVFLSSNPEWEHHELALARVREGMGATQFVQQLSFKIDSLDDLRDFTHRLGGRARGADRAHCDSRNLLQRLLLRPRGKPRRAVLHYPLLHPAALGRTYRCGLVG